MTKDEVGCPFAPNHDRSSPCSNCDLIARFLPIVVEHVPLNFFARPRGGRRMKVPLFSNVPRCFSYCCNHRRQVQREDLIVRIPGKIRERKCDHPQ